MTVSMLPLGVDAGGAEVTPTASTAAAAEPLGLSPLAEVAGRDDRLPCRLGSLNTDVAMLVRLFGVLEEEASSSDL